jgi:hypothetical protein
MSKVKVLISFFVLLAVAFGDDNSDSFTAQGNDNSGNGNGNDNNGNGVIHRDICVVGGGASGMATAAFAKDNGYSVVVLEKKDYVGGHCKTTLFTPQTPGGANYVDLGVQLFPDTRIARLAGLWNYTINTTDIVRRFAGSDAVLYATLGGSSNPNFLVDINIPLYVPIPPSAPSTDFQLAFARLFGLLVGRYPWLSAPGYPDPLPAELLVTFDQWVVANNFTILVPFFSQLTDNLGNYREVSAVYILAILSPTVLNFFGTPNTAFRVKGGCSKIYQGIATYLGSNNVILNAKVTSVNRQDPGQRKVQIRGRNTQNGQSFKYSCGDVVIAFAQTTDNLDVWDLDDTEERIFSQVGTRNYWWGTANLTGNAVFPVAGGFSLQIRNLTDPFQTPPYPSLIQVSRADANQQPAAWYAASGTQKIADPILALKVLHDFGVLKNGLGFFDSVALTDFNFHEYQPFVKNVTALATSPTLYTQIANIQGHRHTYYVGALTGYAGTYIVWENAYKLVQHYFPA